MPCTPFPVNDDPDTPPPEPAAVPLFFPTTANVSALPVKARSPASFADVAKSAAPGPVEDAVLMA